MRKKKIRGFGPYSLPSMNPIYLAYLKAHGLATEPDLYKFIIWATGKADEYKRHINSPNIVDHNAYIQWVKQSIRK